MVFEYVFSNFFSKFKYICWRKIYIGLYAFVRKGKWSLETAIKFPINSKKTKFNEVSRYLMSQTGDESMKITGSNVW